MAKLKIENYLNKKFDRLLIIEDAPNSSGRSMVVAKCDCGSVRTYFLSSINRGRSKSCGCLAIDKNKERLTKHGLGRHALYHIWHAMKKRCYSKICSEYHNYGARGIIVCDEWRHDFKAFYDWALLNGWQKGLQIDRKENDGNYEPGNCRCVTSNINQRNTRQNHIIEYNGTKKTMIEWSEELGMKYDILKDRINYSKLSIEEAFTLPVKYRHTRWQPA